MAAPTTRHFTQLLSLTAPAAPGATPSVSVSFPSTDLSVEIKDAGGVTTRWGSEDRNAENVPRNITFGTQRMQGFGSGGVILRRLIDRDWVDVHLLDDIAFIGAGGDVAYEGRVGAMPRSFGTDHSVSLQLGGHMALASDRTFTDIFVDRDLNAWTEPSRARKAAMLAADVAIMGFAVAPDPTDGLPGLVTTIDDSWVSPYTPLVEGLYDAGTNNRIGAIYYDYTLTNSGGTWGLVIGTQIDDKGTSTDFSGALGGAASGAALLNVLATSSYRYGVFRHSNSTTPGGAQGSRASAMFRKLAVYGDHELPLVGTAPYGITASDVVRHIVSSYCSGLSDAGVQDTGFAIPHLVFREPTKPYDAFLAVNAYHLWTLAVWEGKTLHYGPTDLTDYDWEVRTDDKGVTLDLQGDSIEDLANGVVVTFTNVETGLADVLTPDLYPELRDTAIDNPANLWGRQLWTSYQLSFPTTRAAALQLGRAALAEFNAPKAPGSITASHYIRDRAGHYQPTWKVRAGDRIAITSSTSLSDRPRLIQETSYSHDDRSVTISVDSTARTLPAVIDRITTALSAANLT